jgi:high-affinity K+ transport system ATPase subunit B
MSTLVEDATSLLPQKLSRSRPLFDSEIVTRALRESIVKLNPLTLAKNPVMFVVEVGAMLTTVIVARDLVTGAAGTGFGAQIALWLWFTVLFANFAEAMAEARGKAQADTLRKTKIDVRARRIVSGDRSEVVSASALRAGDIVICEPRDIIPGDGEVIEGVASIDESVITGESAPMIRESGGDRSAVTGGTRVLSDWIKVRITSNPGETFLDRMIALVKERGGTVPAGFSDATDRIARTGGTPLAVADGPRVLGLVHLKDVVKGGMKERIAQLRLMGIRSVMITGDNPLTAAIASEAGVDDFLAQATPKDKLEYIRKEQAEGRLVAMTGDGTNDAPALGKRMSAWR